MLQSTSNVLFDSENESETDSIEEIHITKQFEGNLLQSIQQAKSLLNSHTGIKRQPGFYHLQDCKHAVFDKKNKRYTGRHYDVKISNSLQRATQRLTKYFIDKEIQKEQARRIYFQSQFQKEAETVLSAMNKEFKSSLNQSTEKELNELKAVESKQQLMKDALHTEMLRKHNAKLRNEDTEIERRRQIELFKIMQSDSFRSPTMKNLIEDLMETGQKKAIIHKDLLEAFSKLKQEEDNEEEMYRRAVQEIKDEALSMLVVSRNRQNNRDLEEQEKQRRIREITNPESLQEMWNIRVIFDGVMRELKETFSRFQEKDEFAAKLMRQEVEERKEAVLCELRRNVAVRYVQKVCSIDKLRRMKEAEEMVERKSDSELDRIKTVIVTVQRQMILQKFGGKWINYQHGPQSDNSCYKTDLDKKLHEIRTTARHYTCVTTGAEY